MDQPFQWGANGARMTPEEIVAQRKVADALMAQGSDASPLPTGTRGWGELTQGLARVAKGVSAGLDYREADAASKANAAESTAGIQTAIDALNSRNGAAAPPAASAAASAAASPVAAAPAQAAPTAASTSDRIYNEQDRDNPFEPSAADRDATIRTVYGEAANEPPKGQLAVASVIRNRAFDGGYGGNTASAVVHAPNQFEPWNGGTATARMQALSPNDPKYVAIGKVVDAANGTVTAADDPTEGKTMFYSPGAQAALGRPAPAWATGEGQQIGGHTFYDDNSDAPKAAAGPVQVASNGPIGFAAPAAVSPGVAAVTAAASGTPAQPDAPTPVSPGVAKVSSAINPALLQTIASPYASAGAKEMAKLAITQQIAAANKEVHSQETDKDGNIWDVNKATGEKNVKLKNEEANPKWAIIGKDQYGQPTYGYTPTPAEYKEKQAAAAASAPVPDGPDLTNVHGKEYMDALSKQNPGYASTVQAIIEGRAPYPTGMLLKTPYGQKLAQDVTQADPTFEAGNATSRVKVRNEFTAGGVGSPAGQITAGNTAIQHAGEMSDALERMKADDGVLSKIGSSDIPYVSRWANEAHNSAVQGTSAGAPLNDFMTAKNHFAEEVTKFYAGSAGSEAERTRALANLDAAKSLPELRSAIKTEANLMQGKVNALQDRWRTGMGPLVSDFPLVQPKSQAAIDSIMKRDASSTAPPEATPAAAPTVLPAPAVAKLTQNPTPEMQAHFDEIFGTGAAARALGGK